MAHTKDTFRHTSWIPMEMHTNRYGASMVVYEEQSSDVEVSRGKAYPITNLGRLGISILNDEGKEIQGILIPKSQSVEKRLSARNIAGKNASRGLFSGSILSEYYSQFGSYSFVSGNAFNHVIVNDIPANFNKGVKDSLSTVRNFEYTSAVCYTLNRKRELSKRYLFGTPTKDESNACMLESAWYDEGKKVYAAIVLQRKGDKLESRVAWCKLDEGNNAQ